MLNKFSRCSICLGLWSWGGGMWDLMVSPELPWIRLCLEDACLFLLTFKKGRLCTGSLSHHPQEMGNNLKRAVRNPLSTWPLGDTVESSKSICVQGLKVNTVMICRLRPQPSRIQEGTLVYNFRIKLSEGAWWGLQQGPRAQVWIHREKLGLYSSHKSTYTKALSYLWMEFSC